MKPILALNAFDIAAAVEGPLGPQLRRRAALFGAASMLFYQQPLELLRGEGCWLYDAAGTAYLDAYNNVACVGHSHPVVVEAVARQLGQLNTHSRYLHPAVLDYAARLLATLPGALSNITFTCTGSESNDLALRLAAAFTGARGVIVTAAAYHGNTASVTEVSPSAWKRGAPPPHVRVVPAPAADSGHGGPVSAGFAAGVQAAIEDLERGGVRCGALLVDSIFSSDGVYADPPGFLAAAVAAVHRAGGVFIADEVQPGFGRTGDGWWGFQRHGVLPDIVTLGKPMGNGYPVSAVVTRPEILDTFCAQVGYFNTFAASAVAAVAGSAVMQVIEDEGLIANAAAVGLELRQGLAALAARHAVLGGVRGAGLYVGADVVTDAGEPAPALATAIVNGLRRRGVLIGVAGRLGEVLKIRPPLCFTPGHAERLLETLAAVLTDLPRT